MQTNHHVGRLTKVFTMNHIGQKQTAKVSLCLAVPSTQSGKKETNFIYYQAYGKTAELLNQYANIKGILIEVVFTMRSRNYTDSTGKNRYLTENVISEFQVLNGPKRSETNDSNQNPKQSLDTDEELSTQGDSLFSSDNTSPDFSYLAEGEPYMGGTV